MRISVASRSVLPALLILVSGPAAWAGALAPPRGDAEYRAAWKAFAAPAGDPSLSGSLEARQQARLAAIPSMEAAAAADPGSLTYLESLGYIYLSAGQYDKARTAIDHAIERRRDLPLLYLLRGQAEAALAQMDPPRAGEQIGPAITALERAAQLDPTNALPLLQAASVAIDLNRPDLALPRIRQALERPNLKLYRLSVPTDLGPDPGASVRAWQYSQLEHWLGLISRCQNVAAFCFRLGAEEDKNSNLAAAEERFQWALQVGRLVGGSEPSLFIAVAPALDVMEDGYRGLARVTSERLIRSEFLRVKPAVPPSASSPSDDRELAKLLIRHEFASRKASPDQEKTAYQKWTGMDPAPTGLDDARWTVETLASFYHRLTGSGGGAGTAEGRDLERWLGEAGVVAFARGQVLSALQLYLQEIAKGPPTVESVLAEEAKQLAPVIAGVAIRSLPPRPAQPEAKPKAKAAKRSSG